MPEVIIDLRPGSDWSLDLCRAGLVMNLGNAVFDIPYKDRHREWWDVIEGKRERDWGLERRTLGFVPSAPDDRKSCIPEMDAKTARRLILSKDVRRVWLDERAESFVKYCELGFAAAKIPAVVVAGHDRFWNFSPAYVGGIYGDRLEAMLLDNWKPEYEDLPFPVRRIGWSCNFDHYWTRPDSPPEKDIDICFVGYNSHPDRARFIRHIREKWGHLNLHLVLEEEPDSFGKFVSKAELFDLMLRSKICLNLRGAAEGGKTLRAYEIAHVGSFMLSQQIDDIGMRCDFVPDGDCMYFRDENELDIEIGLALESESHREFIARNCHKKSKGVLSTRSRWASVLKWLKEP